MYVRKKKNRSGTASIVAVNKIKGRFQELKTIDASSDEKEISVLCQEGQRWIDMYCGHRDILLESERKREENRLRSTF